MHFLKKSGRLSSTGSKILTFGSHCSTKFQPILDYFIPTFKLEYDDLENIKNRSCKCSRFQLTSNQTLKFFLGHPVHSIALFDEYRLSNNQPWDVEIYPTPR